MGVDSKHSDYTRMAPLWLKMRDVYSGQEQIHFRRERYLPTLNGEEIVNYHARLTRTLFFNATYRTIAGLVGMMFKKAPVVEVPAGIEDMLDDVTKSGIDLPTFVRKVAEESLIVGRVGVLVDYPSTDTSGMTQAQAEALNLRPNLAMYTAESIINWRTDWINNKTVLSLVVLSECIKQKDPNDEFVTKDVEQFRVLDLVPSDTTEGGYAYRVRVFQKLSAGFVPVQNFIPLMNGAPLPYIPFQFIGVDNTTPSIDEPPLIDLANVNISHYQTTADLEHGAHKTALPQPWANNIATAVDTSGKPVKQTFHYGGGSLWTFPSDTTVGMLEYTGQGLEALEKRLEVKENQMAILGARMLEAQKKQAETADTAAIHRSGEQASLAGQANTISRAMNNVLAWFAAWAGQSGDTKFAINTDFFAIPLDAQTILALVSSWQQGAISKETLFDNFQRGEIVSEATTFEDEEAKISNNPPMMSLGGQANPNEPGGSANNGGTGGQGNGPATGAV